MWYVAAFVSGLFAGTFIGAGFMLICSANEKEPGE
jgi:formate/nitrite transporter FocA (FNT family)